MEKEPAVNDQVVKKVVIAGGGTAGWIVAAALSRQLGPLIDITLVESDDIGTVGVGESTIPTHRTFHHLLGIDEREFMRATQATFKLGISFEGWGEIGDHYFHSFGMVGKSTWMADFHHIWLQAREMGLAGELGDYCLELKAAQAGKFATSEKSQINFAYHLDAGVYAGFLRKLAEAYGTKRIEGLIETVEQDGETGNITTLVLRSGERIDGDLFIDCTGFRAMLIGKTLNTGFEDWTQWLPTDRALAVQTESTGPALPYTRAIAHDAGWRWRIPLQHRVGNGLVYCGENLSDDEARARLLAELDSEPLTEPRLIRYRTGRRDNIWVKNCVSIGLSSGFVEPLESTSIHLIQIHAMRLVQMFPFHGISEALSRRYNHLARIELEQIRDFIVLHYKLTERTDSVFWRDRAAMPIPDSLRNRIELFRDTGLIHQEKSELFQVDSWLQVMMGQRLQPQGRHHLGRLMSTEQMQIALNGLRANVARGVDRMPLHQDFLNSYLGEPVGA
ncbi:tryptophan halogenase [Hyphomonas johnsonii MHS-2]|uniref:Tryptophan halogenase n=1 Tax=Hyphomonas johnsonii MHS-2 TaxID=1280950 RepID=A0A059FS99_9PROT|nr:tryptophan halogenase [Hyphomonas johnsonii MHS-2]